MTNSHLSQAEAASRACRSSVISHRSAAIVYGLPLLGPLPSRPDITVAPRAPGSFAAAHLYRASLEEHDVVFVGELCVTSVARTLVDLARHSSLSASVAAIDYALHESLVDCESIDEVRHRCATWPGIRRANQAVRLADRRAESPLESISRLALTRMRVPPPIPQQEIYDQRGRFVGRVDFGWAESRRTVGEADGLTKYSDSTVLHAEKLRQERLEQAGLIVVRWTWSEITRSPQVVEARILEAFARAERLDPDRLPLLLPV